jgi:hypothetical protein
MVILFENQILDKWGDIFEKAGLNSRILPANFAVIIFATIYQLVLSWDALWNHRQVQIIGIVAYSFALLLYVIIQRTELNDSFSELASQKFISLNTWNLISPLSIALPCIGSFSIIIQILILRKLFRSQTWSLYQRKASCGGFWSEVSNIPGILPSVNFENQL